MTAPAKASVYVTGLCGSDRHLDCRGEYAGTRCTCECHLPPKPVAVVAPPAIAVAQPGPSSGTALGTAVEAGLSDPPVEYDLGDALARLDDGVEGLDLALLTFDGNDIEWADLLGQVRSQRMRLADLESLIERQTAKHMTGDILEWPGGLAERRHGKDRKEWDNESVIRYVRDAVTRPLVLNVETGTIDRELAALIALALDAYSDTNRPTWRVTKLKALGIDPDEFCTAIPGRTTVQVTLGSRPEEGAA